MSTLTGIVHDLDERVYHAHPSLSSTGARSLLRAPAIYRHEQTNREQKKAFDIGHAVHAKVLGAGSPVEVLDFDSFRTKAAQEARDAAYAAGLVPLLTKEMEPIERMVEAVLARPDARELLEHPGHPEASVFGTDPDTRVPMRARFDYLPDFTAVDPWTVDLKTGRSASPDGFAKAAAEHRYDIQQEWYLHLYALATGDFTGRMKFIVVEKEPPYLVGVYALAPEFADMGHRKVRQALETYAACSAADLWPGYPTNSDPLQPPSWLMFQEGAIA